MYLRLWERQGGAGAGIALEGNLKGTMKTNEEFHELIDDLAERKFFGEITLYFQGGNIESSRQSERISKTEIEEIMAAKKRKRLVVTVRKGSGGTV